VVKKKRPRNDFMLFELTTEEIGEFFRLEANKVGTQLDREEATWLRDRINEWLNDQPPYHDDGEWRM